jgi:hypothetical protein
MKPFSYGRRLLDERQRLRRWIDPRYRSLRLPDVVAYLEAHGWQKVTPDRPRCLVFQEPGNPPQGQKPFHQFVPDSEEYDDYPQGIFELLTGLAEVEDRQVSAVIDDILALAGRNGAHGLVSSHPADTAPAP